MPAIPAFRAGRPAPEAQWVALAAGSSRKTLAAKVAQVKKKARA